MISFAHRMIPKSLSAIAIDTLPGKHFLVQRNDSLATEPRYRAAPTFPEFVDWLLDTEVERYNEHWLPYYLLCTPCHLNYTVIAKTEAIAEDSRCFEFLLLEHNAHTSGHDHNKHINIWPHNCCQWSICF